MENQNQDKVPYYVKKLNGITYFEWLRLSQMINADFLRQQHEHERKLVLASETSKILTNELNKTL